jgi:hypothetical protein
MSFIVTTEYDIDRIAAPNLPLAPEQWNRQYQDQFANVMRLYFNRLDNFISRLDANGVVPPLTNFTVDTLPSAESSGAGARAFVTDALSPTFGATVTTGGAVAVPVYSDGTNWKVG